MDAHTPTPARAGRRVCRPALALAAALAAALGTTLAAAAVRAQPAANARYDVVLRGGTVVDGSGGPRFRADVAVRGGRIVRVDPAGIPADQGARVLNARGLVVAPGFVDNHAHVATDIARMPLAENFLRQGVTTILASLHAQDEPWPLDAYAASLRAAPNVGFFAGHSWIRARVLGLANRAATPTELAHMRALVDSSMRQGALGLATGLEYVPANYASTEEVVALAAGAARHGGIYFTHLRDEGPALLPAVREAIRVAREAGLPAQINHLKASGAAQFGASRLALALLDSARAAGVDISADVYPYTAFSTISDVLFPQWALADGPQAFARRAADPATRARIEREMRAIFPQQAGRDLASVQFREIPADRRYDGRTLADYVRARGRPPTIAEGVRALVDLQRAGGFIGIFHAMDEGDVVRILRHPWTTVDSDGDLVGYGRGFPHPRSYGAFPRVLARYVRERRVLTLEEAVRKMTSSAAEHVGQRERGLVRAGFYADLVAFDAAGVRDLATYTDPHRFPVGVVHVLVNGVPVVRDGALTGERPGRVLRGPVRLTPAAPRAAGP